MKFPSRFSYLVLSAFLALGFLPEKANAQVPLPPLVSCTGKAEVTYSPGLTNAEKPVTVTFDHQFRSCANVLLPATQATARAQSSFTADLSCDGLLDRTNGKSTIVWHDENSNSVWDWESTSVAAGPDIVATFQGKISSGRYQGRTARATVALGDAMFHILNSSCDTNQGITELEGPITLIIL